MLAATSAFILPRGGRTQYGVTQLTATNTVQNSSVITVRRNFLGALTAPHTLFLPMAAGYS
jgi:hypothetical protein